MSDHGRIDINLESATVDEVLELLEQVLVKLWFLLRLDRQEKKRLPKPRAGSDHVADEVLELQVEAGVPVPADDPLVADLSVARGLSRIEDVMSDIMARIEDTRYLAASEAWSECLVRYGMLRQLARSKPQLRDRLKRLQPLVSYRRKRRAAPPAPDAEAPKKTEK